MPRYVYRCAKCGEQIEAFQTFAEAPLTKHGQCGGKLSKVLSAAGIVLKGSGFYKTDNRSGSSNGKSREKSKESSGSGSSSDSGSGSSSKDSGSSSSDSGSSKPSTDAKSSSSSSSSEAKSA